MILKVDKLLDLKIKYQNDSNTMMLLKSCTIIKYTTYTFWIILPILFKLKTLKLLFGRNCKIWPYVQIACKLNVSCNDCSYKTVILFLKF